MPPTFVSSEAAVAAAVAHQPQQSQAQLASLARQITQRQQERKPGRLNQWYLQS
jgi:hypothetical protein